MGLAAEMVSGSLSLTVADDPSALFEALPPPVDGGVGHSPEFHRVARVEMRIEERRQMCAKDYLTNTQYEGLWNIEDATRIRKWV